MGRFPEALVLALGTVVVGTLLILRIHAEAVCSPCFRGFVRGLLGPGAACVQCRLPRAVVPGGGVAGVPIEGHEQDDGRLGWLLAPFAGGEN